MTNQKKAVLQKFIVAHLENEVTLESIKFKLESLDNDERDERGMIHKIRQMIRRDLQMI